MILLSKILLAILYTYITLNVGYILFFSLIAAFSRKQKPSANTHKNRFILLFPTYKGDKVILNSVRESWKQNYPGEFYDIFVIADHLQQETVAALRQNGAQVLEVNFENSTKSKSLNAALAVIDDDKYDYAIIMDIDNIMHEEFLTLLNNSLAHNPLVVQAHRVAQNMDTDFAVLDALSEEINNSIFRKAHVQIGLSCALIGSGIAIRYTEFKVLMAEIQAVGGFDKEMEVRLLRASHSIEYLENALVYDEKVQEAGIFENQRKRWLSAQFHYLGLYFFDSVKQLFLKGNVDYFNKVLQFMLLPRVMLLGITLILGLAALILPDILPYGRIGVLLPFLVLFSLYLATPAYLRNKRSIIALRRIPLTMLLLFRTLLRLKGANKKFIHTPHAEKK